MQAYRKIGRHGRQLLLECCRARDGLAIVGGVGLPRHIAQSRSRAAIGLVEMGLCEKMTIRLWDKPTGNGAWSRPAIRLSRLGAIVLDTFAVEIVDGTRPIRWNRLAERLAEAA